MMEGTPYWKVKPTPVLTDWRAWSLAVPSVLLALGFFCFALLGYSFKEFQELPSQLRTWLVLVGAALIAAGGEVGTCTATIEIFRKQEDATIWDKAALLSSAITTLAAVSVAASYLPSMDGIAWVAWVQTYGPAVLLLFSVADGYFTFAECGMYLGSYDKRMEAWHAGYERAQARSYRKQEQELAPPQAISEPEELIVCRFPGCDRTFTSKAAEAGHQKAHRNGHEDVKEPVRETVNG